MGYLKTLVLSVFFFFYGSVLNAQTISRWNIGTFLMSNSRSDQYILQGSSIHSVMSSGNLHLSSQFVGLISGIQRNNYTEIKIYPNPTNGTIQVVKNEEIYKIQVLDNSLKEVLMGFGSTIDLSMLSNGAYTIIITTKANNIYSKIILLNK
jgi:hypothetical protein